MFCKKRVLRNFAKLNFIKKETLTQVFSCEFCEISKNNFFTEHFRWLLLPLVSLAKIRKISNSNKSFKSSGVCRLSQDNIHPVFLVKLLLYWILRKIYELKSVKKSVLIIFAWCRSERLIRQTLSEVLSGKFSLSFSIAFYSKMLWIIRVVFIVNYYVLNKKLLIVNLKIKWRKKVKIQKKNKKTHPQTR